ncbi:flagellar hook-associated protein FlgK [Kistimonas asteriae]|uniref:flagellar hook-associated protein FlgK n=1 Tax=Kistimonas asteriae TaxID=517724 RepID=UPI001BA4E9CD|nr:flagellar hook-associated protein FlgK [Kistimonas asteriae]
MSLLEIGKSGILASQRMMETSSHNVTNVNTPGFTRQDVQLYNSPGVVVGDGVTTGNVRRINNEFLTAQIRENLTVYNQKATAAGYMSSLDSYLGNESSVLTTGLERFFSAVNAATVDPLSSVARQNIISEAGSLSQQFHAVYEQLEGQASLLDNQMEAAVEQVNSLVVSIAGYNESIRASQNSIGEPNDLLDLRERALEELSGLIGITVLDQGDGMAGVYLNSGHPLVLESQYNSLTVIDDPLDPNVVGLGLDNTFSVVPLTGNVSGTIGGLQEFQTGVLSTALNEIGRVATVFSDQVNNILSAGFDLGDRQGWPSSQMMADINWQSAMDRVVPADGNTGSAEFGVSVTSQTSIIAGGEYVMTVTGGNYDIVRSIDSVSVASGTVASLSSTNPSFDGLEMALFTDPANIQNGDVYTVEFPLSGIPAAERIRVASSVAGSDAFMLLSVQDSQQLTASDYELRVLDNGGTPEYRITRKSDGQQVGSGTVPTTAPPGAILADFDGLQLTINGGTLNTGEIYLLQPTRQGGDEIDVVNDNPAQLALAGITSTPGDNTIARNLADLQASDVIGGEFSLSEGYSQLVGRVAVMTFQTNTAMETTNSMLLKAQEERNNYSGVNLDEEAMTLIRAEQAYAASAQVVASAQRVFDTLIGLL